MTLTITVDVQPHRIRLTLSGELDIDCADQVRAAISNALTGTQDALVVDLAAVTLLDSAGIAALVDGRHRAEAVGCGFQVVSAQDSPRRVLEISNAPAHLLGPTA